MVEAARRRPAAPLVLIELLVWGLGYDLLMAHLHGLGPDWTRSLVRPDAPRFFSMESPALLVSFGLACLVAFPLLRVLVAGWRARDFGLRTGLTRTDGRVGGFLLCLMLLISTSGFLLLPSVRTDVWAAYAIRGSGDLAVLLLLVVPIYAALGEELMFRSYAQGALMECDDAWGTVLPAVAFALVHSFQGWVPIVFFHLPGALVFACVYRRTRSLPLMVAIHLLFDLLAFGVLYLIQAVDVTLGLAVAGGLWLGSAAGVIALRGGGRTVLGDLRDVAIGLKPRWARFVLYTACACALGWQLLRYREAWGEAIWIGAAVILLVGAAARRRGHSMQTPSAHS